MIQALRLKFYALLNRLRRFRGPSLADQCAKVIMHMCAIQLERSETRELAPTPGAVGPMVLSGGAITTVTYHVFDDQADRLDKKIREEPWRAFTRVTMRLTLERDPEFEVEVNLGDGKLASLPTIGAKHRAPGVALVKQLAQYFPILPKAHTGPIIKPEIVGLA